MTILAKDAKVMVDGLPRFVYRMFKEDAGGHAGGHRHLTDHVTICTAGRIRIGEAVLEAGQHVIVPANAVHTVLAIEDGSSWICLHWMPERNAESDQDRRDFWGTTA